MTSDRLGVAAGLGAVAGLRSMTPLAMVSRELADRRSLPRGASALEEWLARDLVAIALTGLALGELAADKLPGIPDRISPGPLFGRAMVGGILGAIAVDDDDRPLGILVGVAAAAVGAYLGWFLRREAGRVTMLPDAALALGEDALAVAASRELAQEI
jgi:uncharacterized membrane protein